MKLLALLGFVLVHQIAATCDEDPATGASQGSFERFTQAINRNCRACRCQSCCPVIVRNCAPRRVGTVIEAYGVGMVNAAVIVDWGCTEYNPCGCGCPKGRLCTPVDTNFVWGIDWGDGTIHHGNLGHIGPFHKTYQYGTSGSYQVTVHFCHNPGCPAERCCDSYSQVITVNCPSCPSPSTSIPTTSIPSTSIPSTSPSTSSPSTSSPSTSIPSTSRPSTSSPSTSRPSTSSPSTSSPSTSSPSTSPSGPSTNTSPRSTPFINIPLANVNGLFGPEADFIEASSRANLDSKLFLSFYANGLLLCWFFGR